MLRKALTDIFGDGIPSQYTTSGNIYTADFSFDISAYNADKIDIIAFVLDGTSKNVKNVQRVHVGQNIDFD